MAKLLAEMQPAPGSEDDDAFCYWTFRTCRRAASSRAVPICTESNVFSGSLFRWS